jgi:GNAT superfamily N-acetyltransferase
MGIVNHRYNDGRGARTARFSHLESVDRHDVTRALLSRVEAWARERGMERVEGPRGFTDQDPEGLLVEGFEREPALSSYQNRESMVRMVEEAGYHKAIDYVVYRIPVPEKRPEFYERIRDRVLSRGKYRLLEFESRRALRPWILPILEMMDETFRDLDGYSPLDPGELRGLARHYTPIVDPRFVKIVLVEDQAVGFIIALPSLNEGLRRARGRLLPVGWFHILRSARTSRRQLDLLLGGTREGHRGRGVDVLLGDAMTRSAHRVGFEYMDSHHELESNVAVRREMERMGGLLYKRFRVFEKAL